MAFGRGRQTDATVSTLDHDLDQLFPYILQHLLFATSPTTLLNTLSFHPHSSLPTPPLLLSGKTFLKGLEGFTATKKTSMFLRMMCGLAPNGKEVALPAGSQVGSLSHTLSNRPLSPLSNHWSLG